MEYRYGSHTVYFCATVGQVTDEMIQEYIEQHSDNFKMDSELAP